MSKYIKKFHAHILKEGKWPKFFDNQTPGGRIFPPKTGKNDAAFQLRYDAGEVVNGKKNIILQINSQANSPVLKKYISNKKGAHAKVATVQLDVNTPEDKKEEAVENMLKDATTQFKSKIG